jgi:uncharacterized membrane protein YkvA (DUF1232 family)
MTEGRGGERASSAILATMHKAADWGQRLRNWARSLKREVRALWIAVRDPSTPWYARLLGLLVLGYALSPIDLIPDFIPVLGYLDDVILLPLALALLRRLIPPELLAAARQRAEEEERKGAGRPRSRLAALLVIMTWLLLAALAGYLLLRGILYPP